MNNNFNLLLKKQIIKQVKRNENPSDLAGSEETYYEEDYSSLLVTRSSAFKISNITDNYEQVKLELANVELQESQELEHHKTLIKSYNLVDSLIEHVLNYIECVFLETKSSQRLSECLNAFAKHENCLTQEISSCIKKISEKMDFSDHSELKTQLLLSFGLDEKLRHMSKEFDKKYANYKLALKNFKIILEVLNINEESLAKLKQQFDEVLMDYQHCRCVLDQELPFSISKRIKLLAKSLNILSKEYGLFGTQRNTLNALLKGIAEKLQQDDYNLAKEELFETEFKTLL